ncbi:MAG: DUF2497 domain-containing protein [Proteobacteria bacterium]|nr:DUF2497 domain-containing protein [Pseudomonadota bacterium]
MASSPQHEPTMEEILASIRKIISEDSTEAAPAEPAPVAAAPAATAPAPAPAPATAPAMQAPVEEEDVLELTEEAPEPAPAAAVAAADEVVFQTVEAPAPPSSGSDIFSEKTRRALDEAFNTLDNEEEDAAKSAPAPMASTFHSTNVDGDSVEAVFERAVRDAVGPHIDQWMSHQKDDLLAAMRPLIREWMDEHFPSILEGAVRDEVARAVKARGKR